MRKDNKRGRMRHHRVIERERESKRDKQRRRTKMVMNPDKTHANQQELKRRDQKLGGVREMWKARQKRKGRMVRDHAPDPYRAASTGKEGDGSLKKLACQLGVFLAEEDGVQRAETRAQPASQRGRVREG